jgi:DNA repair exonuclease SbcCD nuclease subunit
MRVAFLTDLHVLDERLDGDDGHAKALEDVSRAMAVAKPDVILVGGDLAGLQVPHRATPRERNVLVQLLVALADTAPVIVCRGNHDSLGDYTFFNHLRGRHPVVYVEHDPEVVELPGGCAVMVLPWLDRSRYSRDDLDAKGYAKCVQDEYAAALLAEGTALNAARADGDAVLLLGHAAVQGASLRPGQPAVPTEDPVLDLHALLASCPVDAAFFGHYHTRQVLDAPMDALYGGALFAHEYGEDVDKGWLVYDVDTGATEHHPVRQRVKAVVEVDAGLCTYMTARPDGLYPPGARPADWLPGVHVKLVVHYVDGDGKALEWADAQRAALAKHAASVRVDRRPRRSSRTRDGADEVAAATLTSTKVTVYMNKLDPPPDRALHLQVLDELQALETAMDAAP